MSEITFNTEYGGTKEAEWEAELPETLVEEVIHEAVVRGVTECGDYNRDVRVSPDGQAEVYASGTVYAYLTDIIEDTLSDKADDEGVDIDAIDIIDVAFDQVWGTYTYLARWTVEIGSEHVHDSTSDFDEFVTDVRYVRNNLVGGEAMTAKFDRIIRLAVGQEFLDDHILNG